MFAPIYSDYTHAEALIAKWKSSQKKILFTNGCFDILHKGHITYLQEAKNLTDKLILGLNSDESVKILKGPARPINKQEDRAMVLSALRMIDMIIIFSEETPINLIKNVRPDILAKGGDYVPETMPGAEFVRSYGGEPLVLSYLDGYATSEIIRKTK